MADVVPINPLSSDAFHFIPNDEQIIKLLRHRLLSFSAPDIQGFKIKEVNVYDNLNPQEIFNRSEFREVQQGPSGPEKERYCFTKLKRIGKSGKKFVRTTGGGTWKIQRTVEIITGKETFLKRQFSYQSSKSGSTGPKDCDWVMYEYSCASSPFQGNTNQDIAICKVKKKAYTNKPTKRDRSEDYEEDKLRSDLAKIRATGRSDDALQRISDFLMDPIPITRDSEIRQDLLDLVDLI